MVYQILIPAYNAGNTLPKLLTELSLLRPLPQCIIIVDDGSEDDTVEICKNYKVKFLRHNTNMGKGRALKTGFEAFLGQVEAEYLLCMDADLQHSVASIPDFLQYASEYASKFVVGLRNRSMKSMPLHRILSNSMTSIILSSITGQKIEDSQCGFRLIHRNVLQNLELKEEGYQLESEMLLKTAQNGVKISFVPIPTLYNDEKSHMRNFRDTIKFIGLILRFLLNSSLTAKQRGRETE